MGWGTMFARLSTAFVAGLMGSLIFFLASLFFGGDGNSAYAASFYGFWLFAVLSLIGNLVRGQ